MAKPDSRFRHQRAELLEWYWGPAQIGKWWRKDQLPKHISRNQEALARRSRELVQEGRLEQRTIRGVALYRAPVDGQREGEQGALVGLGA